MRNFIIRRVLATIPVLILISVVTFVALRLLPGSPGSAILGPEADPAAVEALNERLGWYDPIYEQYADWIAGVFQGDFGYSQRSNDPVGPLIASRLEATLQLGIMSLALALLIAIPIGAIAGAKPGTPFDYGLTFFAVIGVSVPNFWLAMLLVIIFALELGWFPTQGFTPFFEDPTANLKGMILPAFAIGVALAGNLARQVRASMVEVMQQDYVRTARAKGLRERSVLVRHGFRNALIPVVTVLGLQTSLVVGGAIVIESFFGLPGVGKLIIDSILFSEIPTVQALAVMIALGVAAINLIVDISYAYLDPRIRYS
ncbi:MAG: ABC transporter permease [Chloroflexi bacterium]|nr:ABC transporter permease [Chloroflexota bacterium]